MRSLRTTGITLTLGASVMALGCSDDSSNSSPVEDAGWSFDASIDWGSTQAPTTNDTTDLTDTGQNVTDGIGTDTSASDTSASSEAVDAGADFDSGLTDPGVVDSGASDASMGDSATVELDASMMDASRLLDASLDTDADTTNIDGGASDASSHTDATAPDATIEQPPLVFPEGARIEQASVPDGFAAWQWAEGLAEPRGIVVDEAGNVLVVEQDLNRVIALWDDDADGTSGSLERVVVAEAPGLNHGIALNGGYLYASSDTTVYRWPYVASRVDLGAGQAVVTDMAAGGRHTTRTLLFDESYLYVSSGSGDNVDADSSRAQVRRFSISGLGSPSVFEAGDLFADGLRNEVGLGVDASGNIWGVENGLDQLYDGDLGGDIHNDNPGEELNLFSQPGAFYGYPYCWSEFSLDSDAGMGPGTQWLFENTTEDAGQPFDLDYLSDSWCQDTTNVVPPEMVFPAHVAPLDIKFYPGGNFPDEYNGDALVTFHGSWNAQPPIGYKVVRVPFGSDGRPSGDWQPLYEFAGSGDTDPDWQERPVALAVLANGTLLVTSDDDADRIVAIGYQAQ